jgi:hypothetical protein
VRGGPRRQAPALNATANVAPIPYEIRSGDFKVRVNRQRTPVMHAATGYYVLNLDISGGAELSVTAEDAHDWDAGV